MRRIAVILMTGMILAAAVLSGCSGGRQEEPSNGISSELPRIWIVLTHTKQ